MLATSKITSKGQITLPVSIRRLLNLKEGGIVVFEGDGDRIVLKPSSSLVEYRGVLKGRKKNGAWTDIRKKAKLAVGRRIAG
jgi:AbrB family looped-hinge helix DNA binding protein